MGPALEMQQTMHNMCLYMIYNEDQDHPQCFFSPSPEGTCSLMWCVMMEVERQVFNQDEVW